MHCVHSIAHDPTRCLLQSRRFGERYSPLSSSEKTMKRILVAGAGKIGGMIASLLSSSGDYEVTVVDRSAERLEQLPLDPAIERRTLDLTDSAALAEGLQSNPVEALREGTTLRPCRPQAVAADGARVHARTGGSERAAAWRCWHRQRVDRGSARASDQRHRQHTHGPCSRHGRGGALRTQPLG